MPISYDFKTIFFHIPKTAGSSVEDMLGLRFDRATSDKYLLNHAGTKAYQHYLPADVRSKLVADLGKQEGEHVFDAFKKFTITRNPYDRAVSSYHFMADKHPLFRKTRPNKNDKESVRRSFSSFLQFALENINKYESVNDDRAFDEILMLHHVRPQRHWFRPENLVYDAVFTYENLARDMSEFANTVGCHKSLPHKNPRPSHASRMPWRDFYDRNNIYLFESAYGNDLNLANIVTYPSIHEDVVTSDDLRPHISG